MSHTDVQNGSFAHGLSFLLFCAPLAAIPSLVFLACQEFWQRLTMHVRHLADHQFRGSRVSLLPQPCRTSAVILLHTSSLFLSVLMYALFEALTTWRHQKYSRRLLQGSN